MTAHGRPGGCTWLLAIGAAACGPILGSDDTDTGAGTESTPSPATTAATLDPPSPTTDPTTDPGTATAATTIDPDPSDTGSDSSGEYGDGTCGFLCPPDHEGSGGDGVSGGECDVWSQDCPDGEKCMPWSNDGGNRWNATRCSPIDDPAEELGEPCAVEGSAVSGIDHCDFGLMCLFVDPDTLLGTCVANCGGSEAEPQCDDPSTLCVIEFEGTLHQCLPSCDPLAQDCQQGGCYASGHPNVDDFACGVPILPSVADSEPCSYDWECTPGSMCSRPDRPAACESGDCCTPFCDLSVPEACGPDRVCTPVLPEGQSPGIDNTGYCALP
jgi:hypothetical protein